MSFVSKVDIEALDWCVWLCLNQLACSHLSERLEELVWIDSDGLPGRLDMCECERLLKCPNGTISAWGSEDIYRCEVNDQGQTT